MATNTTSGGAATLHTPVLETPTAGPRAGVKPRVTNGGGGNRNKERVKNQPDGKVNQKKNGVGVGEPARPKLLGRDRSGQGLCRHDWKLGKGYAGMIGGSCVRA